MEAGTTTFGDGAGNTASSRRFTGDKLLRGLLIAVTAIVVLALVFFLIKLISESGTALNKMHLGFITKNDWDVSRGIFGALPLIVGTLITSTIALVIGVPVAVASALFLTEICPMRARRVLTAMLELLAAVPSVVYGLWAFFVLIPAIKPGEQWFSNSFGFLPFVGGNVAGPNYFTAGLILAIMILPIVSAISREVLVTVPREQREAALALGATRWETIWQAVLPPARDGIFSASILGLGRAIGETIAVTIVIGNAATIGHSVFDQGYTLAAVIANEFGEAAADPLHRSALIASGLLLLIITLIINSIAQLIVGRSERRIKRTQKETPSVV
jgi:phosphate ABC transporter permease protein PstC